MQSVGMLSKTIDKLKRDDGNWTQLNMARVNRTN